MKDMKHMKLFGGYEPTLTTVFMLFMCFMVTSIVDTICADERHGTHLT